VVDDEDVKEVSSPRAASPLEASSSSVADDDGSPPSPTLASRSTVALERPSLNWASLPKGPLTYPALLDLAARLRNAIRPEVGYLSQDRQTPASDWPVVVEWSLVYT
jgi:hypothetical protein